MAHNLEVLANIGAYDEWVDSMSQSFEAPVQMLTSISRKLVLLFSEDTTKRRSKIKLKKKQHNREYRETSLKETVNGHVTHLRANLRTKR